MKRLIGGETTRTKASNGTVYYTDEWILRKFCSGVGLSSDSAVDTASKGTSTNTDEVCFLVENTWDFIDILVPKREDIEFFEEWDRVFDPFYLQ